MRDLKKVMEGWRKVVAGVKEILRSEIRPEARPAPVFIRTMSLGLLAALVVVVAVTLFHRYGSPPEKYAPLAVIEKAYYKPVEIRTGEKYPEVERLFDEGMEHYNRTEYAQTIGRLLKSIEEDPNSADAHFYVGVCYLLQGQVDKAIKHLEKTIELDGKKLSEKGYWYLGNAHLVREDGDRALAEFKKVIDFRGDYQFESKETISRIEAIR